MDFSIDGSDSWSTTPFQEKFIKSYFGNQKMPSTFTKETKNICQLPSESSPMKRDSKETKKKKKKLKHSYEIASTSEAKEPDVNSQISEKQHGIGNSKENLKKQKKKQMKCNNEMDHTTFTNNHFEIEKKMQEDSDGNVNMEQDKDSPRKVKNCTEKSTTASKTRKRKKNSAQLQDCEGNNSSTEDTCLKNTKNESRNAKKMKSLRSTSGTLSGASNIKTDNFVVQNKKKKDKPKHSNENSIPLMDVEEEDEALRDELKNSNILKQISKLFEKAPYLNPNFEGKVIDEDENSDNHDNTGSNDDENSIEDFSDSSNEIDEDTNVEDKKDSNELDSIDTSEQDNSDASEEDNIGASGHDNTDGSEHDTTVESEHDTTDKSEHDTTDESEHDNTDASQHDNTDTSEIDSSSESWDGVDDNSMADEEDELEVVEISDDDEENDSDSSFDGSSKESDEIMTKQSSPPKNDSAKDLLTKTQEKLSAAKFRILNEKLYTESGNSAFKYFRENEEEFHDYHAGYRLQVSKWPMNPVDKIIAELKELKKGCVIADLGCGDAKIARSLSKYKVHSFDLVPLNSHVTACNISKVPLSKESVNVAVFCLSLMGTNLKDYLLEAHRILKLGGILKIAEVESRIDSLDKFIKSLGAMGFRMTMKDEKHRLFVFLDFIKEKNTTKLGKRLEISLKPCLYKKR